MAARIDLTLTDEPPIAQAIVIIGAAPLSRTAGEGGVGEARAG